MLRRCLMTSGTRSHYVDDNKLQLDEEPTEPLVEPPASITVYEGTFSQVLRRVKVISVTSCTLTLIGAPLLAVYGNESISLAGRIAVSFSACCFGLVTSGFVWAFSTPYVTRIRVLPAGTSVLRDGGSDGDATTSPPPRLAVVESLSLFARPVEAIVPLSSLQPPRPRPLESFYVPDMGGFYVHDDGWLPVASVGVAEGLVAATEEVWGVEAAEDTVEAEPDILAYPDLRADALDCASQLRATVQRFEPKVVQDEFSSQE